MIIEHPITKEPHKHWFVKVKINLNIERVTACPSLIKYLEATPNKFYSKKAEKVHTRFFDNVI